MVWVGSDLTTPTHLPADARPLCSTRSWMACQTTSDTTTRGWYGCGLLPDAVHGEMQRSVLSCTPLMSPRFSPTSTAGGRRILHPSKAALNLQPCPTESNHPQAPAWCGLSNNRHTSFTSVPFAPTWSSVMYPNPTVLGGNTGASGRRRRWLGRPRSPRGRPSHGDHHRPPTNLGGSTGVRLRPLTAGLIPFCHATPATARVLLHRAGALRSCLAFVRPPRLRLRKVVIISWLRAAPNLLQDGESSGPIRPAAITSMNRIG